MSENLTKGTLSTESGPLVMSNPPHPQSSLASTKIVAKDLDELKGLFEKHGFAAKGAAEDSGAGLPGAVSDLSEGGVENLAKATRSFLNNGTPLSDEAKKLFSDAHGSVALQSYAAQNIIVSPSNPWVISGSGPVVVNVDKVTVQAGGQIQVLTDASITIAELIKE